MAYHVGFLIPDRILITYMTGTMTLDSFREISQKVFAAMDDANSTMIHAVTVIEPDTEYPKNLQDIIGVLKETRGGAAHPKTSWVMTVTSSAIQRFVASLSTQLFVGRVRYGSAPTMLEALEYLQSRDQSLAEFDMVKIAAEFPQWITQGGKPTPAAQSEAAAQPLPQDPPADEIG
ncbi:MAG: hypothetical protein U0670_16325 [Anaerolineae bacterium]